MREFVAPSSIAVVSHRREQIAKTCQNVLCILEPLLDDRLESDAKDAPQARPTSVLKDRTESFL